MPRWDQAPVVNPGTGGWQDAPVVDTSAPRIEVPPKSPADVPPPPPSSAAEEALGGYVHTAFPDPATVGGALKDVMVGGEGMMPSVMSPDSTTSKMLRGMFDAAGVQWDKAKQAFGEGRHGAVLGHLAAAAVPGVGPAVADIAERLADKPTDPEAWGEAAGVVASPLNLLPATKLGAGARSARLARNLEESGNLGLARAIAPEASPDEAARLASRSTPVLHEMGTTRGVPTIRTLRDRIQAVADEKGTAIEQHLAGPAGDIPDVNVAPARGGFEARVAKATLPNVEGKTVSLSPAEFRRLDPMMQSVLAEGMDPESIGILMDPKAPIPQDVPIDFEIPAVPVTAAKPEVAAHVQALSGVEREAARSALARGLTEPDNLMSRRQAVTLRRELDAASNRYRNIVPTEPGPRTESRALDTQANAMRGAISEVDPQLGALNEAESAHLIARDAIKDTINKLGAARGEQYAKVRGLATGIRAATGGGAGFALGGVPGAVVGAVALPAAFELLNATPLRILGANARLAVAKAIADGNINLAIRLASTGLQGIRLGEMGDETMAARAARAQRSIP